MKRKIVVMGAGASGLAFVHTLCKKAEFDITVLEQRGGVGGISDSLQFKGFNLDMGPHSIFLNIPSVIPIIRELYGSDLRMVTRKDAMLIKGRFVQPTPHPNPNAIQRSFGLGRQEIWREDL